MTANEFRPKCLPTAVGSFPHIDPVAASRLVLCHLPEIPVWPQLPKRSERENMYVQYSKEFPGAEVEDGVVYVDTQADLSAGLERLYNDYLTSNTRPYALGEDMAAGFSTMVSLLRSSTPPAMVAFKGQVTGPISQGLQMVDRSRRPLLYDDVLADALAKHLRLVAAEQERLMADVCPNTIMFLDEPYLHAIGSAFIQISREQVVSGLEEVFGGLRGLKGVHCCANTDWPMLMSTSVDIINFDAYEYVESLALYPEDVKQFLRRGGLLGWGIVPNSERALATENVATLTARLLDGMDLLVRKGLSLDDLLETALIMPCCGLGTLSPEVAERVLRVLADVSASVRQKYGLGGVA